MNIKPLLSPETINAIEALAQRQRENTQTYPCGNSTWAVRLVDTSWKIPIPYNHVQDAYVETSQRHAVIPAYRSGYYDQASCPNVGNTEYDMMARDLRTGKRLPARLSAEFPIMAAILYAANPSPVASKESRE